MKTKLFVATLLIAGLGAAPAWANPYFGNFGNNYFGGGYFGGGHNGSQSGGSSGNWNNWNYGGGQTGGHDNGHNNGHDQSGSGIPVSFNFPGGYPFNPGGIGPIHSGGFNNCGTGPNCGWPSSNNCSPVPLPETSVLLGSGILGLFGFSRRKKKNESPIASA